MARATTVALDDYMEALAEEHELPIDLMRQVYELWDRKQYPRFEDFYRELRSA